MEIFLRRTTYMLFLPCSNQLRCGTRTRKEKRNSSLDHITIVVVVAPAAVIYGERACASAAATLNLVEVHHSTLHAGVVLAIDTSRLVWPESPFSVGLTLGRQSLREMAR